MHFQVGSFRKVNWHHIDINVGHMLLGLVLTHAKAMSEIESNIFV